MTKNISIIHKSGKELDAYYRNADICVLFVKPTVYRDFAMPFKLFEFIGRGKPVLASSPIKTAQFVDDNNCGISIPYDEKILVNTLNNIDRSMIKNLQHIVKSLASSQSWEARANEVRNILMNL